MKKSLLVLISVIGMFMLGLNTVAQADPINLALTGSATQSSTYSPFPVPVGAANAIDGITEGDLYLGSVTHTGGNEFQPWWQVDLLGMFDLDQIVLWNRTANVNNDINNDGLDHGYRLSNFNVSVLDDSSQIIWTSDFFTDGGHPDPKLIIYLPEIPLGRIVRVQLNGSEYLSLAEVQVFGADGNSSPVPEPATILLLGFGSAVMAGGAKRLRRKKKE
jgi:hypothetical protein